TVGRYCDRLELVDEQPVLVQVQYLHVGALWIRIVDAEIRSKGWVVNGESQPHSVGGDNCRTELDVTVGVLQSRWWRTGICDDDRNDTDGAWRSHRSHQAGTHTLNIRCRRRTNPNVYSFLKVVAEDVDWRVADGRTKSRRESAEGR